jgi:hypothetical protein
MRSMIEILARLDKLGATILTSGPAEDAPGAWYIAAQIGDIRVLATNGLGWDHVSVSLEYRCPLYDEMKAIKRLCFRDDEWAMELHAPPSKHISRHPYVLHLWRPHDVAIPTPPEIMV